VSQPQRTCIGCRQVDDQRDLVRLVWDEARGCVVVDERRRLPGRGAWVHAEAACVAAATKRRAVARALRRPDASLDGVHVALTTPDSPS